MNSIPAIISILIVLLTASLAAQENNAKPSVRSSYMEERARGLDIVRDSVIELYHPGLGGTTSS